MYMMKRFSVIIIFLSLLAATPAAYAQKAKKAASSVNVEGENKPAAATDDKTIVLAVVSKLFDEMAAANAAGILATSMADSQLVMIQKQPDGKSRFRAINGETFTGFFKTPGAVKEIMYDPKVEVSGDWAMVWGRYVFFGGGKVSHCGINQFNLVRTDAGWKIAGGASTIDINACTMQEKAMKQ